jgi:AraC-like DNA-binding protein
MFEDLTIYTPMYASLFWALVLLLTKKEHNRAKFFLGVFMVAAFILYASHAVFFQRFIEFYVIIDPLYIFATLAVYPLYYWYIKLLTEETGYNWQNLKLLVPSLIFSLISFILYRFMSNEEQTGYIYGFLLGNRQMLPSTTVVLLQKWTYIACRLVFAVQVIYFLIKGRRLVRRYHSQITNFYSNLESKSLIWVNFILYSFVFASCVSLTLNLFGRSMFFESRLLLLIPSVIFSLLLFLIGFTGYIQNHTVADLDRDENIQGTMLPKKLKTGNLEIKLIALFSKKEIYKKPELKITDVSQLLCTNRTYVSELINDKFSCSFVEFVNKYRLDEAKILFNDNPEASIQDVAEQSGFGSTGTFIRVFKNQEGITPGKYRDNLIMSAGGSHGIGYGIDTMQKTVQ